nr:hypothetical protein [Pseudomonas brassicacearum]
MKPHATVHNQRLLRGQAPSYERLQARLAEDGSELGADPIAVHCGWGRLLIGHTFPDPASLAQNCSTNNPANATLPCTWPRPSKYWGWNRHNCSSIRPTPCACGSATIASPRVFRGFRIRRAQSETDWQAINQLYQARGMLPIDPLRLTPRHEGGPVYWLAEDDDTGAVIGSVMGLNHQKAFNRPGNGSSSWCLAVDPQCPRPVLAKCWCVTSSSIS